MSSEIHAESVPANFAGRVARAERVGTVAFNMAFTLILLGLVIYGALYLDPAISGMRQRPAVGPVLVATLMPIATLLLLSLIERLFKPGGPRKSLPSYLLHLQINVFYFFMAGIAGVLTAMAISALAHRLGFKPGLIDLRFAHGKGIPTFLAAAWISAVVADLFFYWFHRTLHRTPFLWAHHKMHHMDPELEAITIGRQNWIEVFLAALFMTLPMTILFKLDNLDPWQLGLLSGSLLTVLTALLGIGHLNVRWQVGRASLFYCSPQMHRIHHSHLPQHQDRNFAFVLPLWDVIFGTYYAPSWDEFPPTGVEGEKEITSFFEAQIFTQREWWRMFRARRQRTRCP
jgi:sterol desaturase/sphingolipid hydroxylase (fatty acid hydroxylase superfamily)